jgi:hypothetical protein
MSNTVFPTLAGITWNVLKSPRWSTKVHESAGGKEMRAAFWSTPIYTWQLTYELLRASALLELQSLIGFFNARQGRFDSFLFSDPADNNVTAHGFGAGDGVKTAFQLQRSLAGPRQVDFSGVTPFSSTPRTNRILYSQDLTNAAWLKLGASSAVAYATPAPDGSLTASRITIGGTTGDVVHQAVASGYTPSVTLATSLWIRVITAGSGNLQIVNASGTDSFNIVPTALWQRLSGTFPSLASGAAGVQIRTDLAGTPWVLDVWGVQQEEAGAPTPYIATTSSAVTVNPSYSPSSADAFEPVNDLNGVLSVYRKDWQGNQQLYPTSRTNQCLWSQDFSNAAWTKTTMSVATGIPDPSGGTGAQTLTATSANGTVDQFLSSAPSLVRSNSVWLRRRTGSGVIQIVKPDNTTYTTVALTSNWTRFSVPGASSVNRRAGILIATSGDAIDAFAFQLEDGPVATSYIATTTLAVAITDYVLSATGLVTLAVAPLLNAILTWTGSYYWRVRFDIDQADFNNFLYQLWELRKIALVSVKT